MTEEEERELCRRIERKFGLCGKAGICAAEILSIEAKEIIKAYRKGAGGLNESRNEDGVGLLPVRRRADER